MAAIEFLQIGVEQYLREPDDEFEALAARVRPPRSLRSAPRLDLPVNSMKHDKTHQ